MPAAPTGSEWGPQQASASMQQQQQQLARQKQLPPALAELRLRVEQFREQAKAMPLPPPANPV